MTFELLGYLTKAQTLSMLQQIECEAKLPRKGRALFIASPYQSALRIIKMNANCFQIERSLV